MKDAASPELLLPQWWLDFLKEKRVAVLHDWAFSKRGGERVLESILELFPQADVHFLFGSKKITDGLLEIPQGHTIHFSFLQSFPFLERFYKWLLPLLPVAVESLDLQKYDFVLSSSHCAAKGGVIAPHARQICYIHSPMRYAWDQERAYFPKTPSWKRPLEILRRAVLGKLRVWDLSVNSRIDVFVANSAFVAKRVERYYGRSAEVLNPSVEVERFLSVPSDETSCEKRNAARTVLIFSAWVPYKNLAPAFEALAEQGHSIIAAGSGSELARLQKKWGPKNSRLRFALNPTDAEVVKLFGEAHTFVFPSLEDFGIVVVEALAAGLQVVVPNRGGASEIIEGQSFGTLFQLGSVESLKSAVQKSLDNKITPSGVATQRNAASRYRKSEFQKALLNIMRDKFVKMRSLNHDS